MVQSATDDETGTAHPKPAPSKFIILGSISAKDEDFLAWQGVHCPRSGTQDAMLKYVRFQKSQDKIRYEREMEQWKTYMRSRLSPGQKKELDDLRARNDELDATIAEQKAFYEARNQDIALSPQNNPQNIPPPSEQSSPQIHSAPPPLEQPLSLNIPQPNGEQMTDPPGAHRSASPETVDANKLTMQQALELFELLQARKSKEADKAITVEAEPVARAPARAEPLSYLTLGTVEGIIASTSPDALQEQTWKSTSI
jgi:hypothetical protein